MNKMELYDMLCAHPALRRIHTFHIMGALEDVLDEHEENTLSEGRITELVLDILENDLEPEDDEDEDD